jgi:hypothetical protein
MIKITDEMRVVIARFLCSWDDVDIERADWSQKEPYCRRAEMLIEAVAPLIAKAENAECAAVANGQAVEDKMSDATAHDKMLCVLTAKIVAEKIRARHKD